MFSNLYSNYFSARNNGYISVIILNILIILKICTDFTQYFYFYHYVYLLLE